MAHADVITTKDPISMAQDAIMTTKEALVIARCNADISNRAAQHEYSIATTKHETALQFESTKYADNVTECKHQLDQVIKYNEDKINNAIMNITAANKALGLMLQIHIMGIEMLMKSVTANSTMQLNLTESNHRLAWTELIHKHQNEITTLQSQQRQEITTIKAYSAESSCQYETKLSGLKARLAELNL